MFASATNIGHLVFKTLKDINYTTFEIANADKYVFNEVEMREKPDVSLYAERKVRKHRVPLL